MLSTTKPISLFNSKQATKYLACICFFSQFFLPLYAQKNYAALVNPFIGTGGHGHTYPGATMPFGMVQLSPDTRLEGWDGCSGYHYSDSAIYGFSHTHLIGTGVADYCDILLMPFTGKVQWRNEDYKSAFSHAKEEAEAGYYKVLLDKYKITAELTTTLRTGIHRYSFPNNKGRLIVDLNHRDEVLVSYIKIINKYEVAGMRRSRSWAQDQQVYFHIKFSKPIAETLVALNDSIVEQKDFVAGNNVKAVFDFDLGSDKQLTVKVGISGVSAANAAFNLNEEAAGMGFDAIRKQASDAWNKELAKINVESVEKDKQVIFYTALYHAMLSPNLYHDVNGDYRTTDGKVYHSNTFTNYTVFSLWDTYRALHSLLNLIDQKRSLNFIQTFLEQYKKGGMLPVWELAANETFCMIGYHSVQVILDAWQKGIRGFDEKNCTAGNDKLCRE